jgi:glycosyltransferase involved in cell wall biosynthesis
LLGRTASLRLVARFSDLVLCVSDAVRTEAAQWIPKEQLWVVRWSADIDPVEPLPKQNDRFRLVILGRKSPGKGQHEAIEALARVRAKGIDAELDIIGDGIPEYEAELLRLVRRLSVAPYVRFMAHRDDGLRLLASADLALICSRHDAFPRTTIEAMKLGVPVVGAADYGVIEQINHGETGMLYTPGNTAELADCIAMLHRDPAARQRIAAQARSWADEALSRRRYGDSLEEALEEAVSRAAGRLGSRLGAGR